MDVSPQAEAVMLLTVSFGKPDSDAARPLTPSEWGAFASWLKDNALTPEDLLQGAPAAMLEGWQHPKHPNSLPGHSRRSSHRDRPP